MSRWQPDGWDDEPESAAEQALEEEFGGEWEIDPNDPSHPDFDLSESAGYAYWEPRPKPFYLRRGFVLVVATFIIVGLLLPALVRIL